MDSSLPFVYAHSGQAGPSTTSAEADFARDDTLLAYQTRMTSLPVWASPERSKERNASGA